MLWFSEAFSPGQANVRTGPSANNPPGKQQQQQQQQHKANPNLAWNFEEPKFSILTPKEQMVYRELMKKFRALDETQRIQHAKDYQTFQLVRNNNCMFSFYKACNLNQIEVRQIRKVNIFRTYRFTICSSKYFTDGKSKHTPNHYRLKFIYVYLNHSRPNGNLVIELIAENK